MSKTKRAYVVHYGYDGQAAVYTTREAAEAAVAAIVKADPSLGRRTFGVRVHELPLNPEVPGWWLVRLAADGTTLLCEPDFFPGAPPADVTKCHNTTGGWEGGAQGYGRTVEEATAKVVAYLAARPTSPPPDEAPHA